MWAGAGARAFKIMRVSNFAGPHTQPVSMETATVRSHPHGAGGPLTASYRVPTSEGNRVASPQPPTGSYEEVIRTPGVSVGCTPQSFQGQAARRKRRGGCSGSHQNLKAGGLTGAHPTLSHMHTCTFTHVYMYTYMCAFTMHSHVCMHIHLHLYVCTHMCTFIHTHACRHTHMQA